MAASVPGRTQPKAESTSDGEGSGLRMLLGRDLVALALVIVFATFAIAVIFFSSAQDVVAVVAPVTTLVGTLIGTIFGVQTATSAGAAQQQAAAATASTAAAAAALVEPSRAGELFRQWNSTDNGNPDVEEF